MIDQLWSWALTIVGATCFYLAGGINGKNVWWAWYIGLFAQVLWLTYALFDLDHRAGFLAGVAIYGFVYVRNCIRWTRKHFAEKSHDDERRAMIRRIADNLDLPVEILLPPRRRWWRRLAPNGMDLSKHRTPPTGGPEGIAGDSGAVEPPRPPQFRDGKWEQ